LKGENERLYSLILNYLFGGRSMKTTIIILSMLIFGLFALSGCIFSAKFKPDMCGFDNIKDSRVKYACRDFLITSSGIDLSVEGRCLELKASDCPLSFAKSLKLSGDCNDEAELGNGPVKFCKTGLSSGQRVDIDLQLTYTYDGVPKTISGKLQGRVG
jgi:hypothetical protein